VTGRRGYREFLRLHEVRVVLDLADMDTLPVLAAKDAAGVSYVNTALNDANCDVLEMVAAVHPTREEPRRAAHILRKSAGILSIWTDRADLGQLRLAIGTRTPERTR
jgi:hypothetical protein